MKIALKILGLVIVAVTVAVLAVLVAGVPSRLLNSALRDRMAPDTPVQVAVNGATRIKVFPLRLSLADVGVRSTTGNNLQASLEHVEVAISVTSLLSSQPTASTVTLTRPVLQVPLVRDRSRVVLNPAPAPASTSAANRIPFDRLIVANAEVLFSDPASGVEQRIQNISADVQVASDRRIAVVGSARLGDAPASFTLKTRWPISADAQPAHFDLTFDAPGLVNQAIAARGDAKLTGSVFAISNLSGRFGDNAFDGWASADLSSKPLIKLDVALPHLAVDPPSLRSGSAGQSWSTRPFDLASLNYVDLQGRFSIAETKLGALQIAPAELDVTLAAGAMKAHAARLGVGGGEVEGEFVLDASGKTPELSLRADVTNVRAKPLLDALAGFSRLDGRMTAKFALRGSGGHPRAVAASLGGTAFGSIRDGEITGINLAQMIRTLTASMLSGWQDNGAEATDFTELSASLRLENGQGATRDLVLAGPLVRMTGAGNLDIVSETIAFRVEPKLVMTLQGQGTSGNGQPSPVGLGVPVIVQGPWASPRIYPEIGGMLENPDAAYAQLRQMGQGLFGRDLLGKDLQGLLGGLGDKDASRSGQSGLDDAVSKIIQGLSGRTGPSPATPPAASDRPAADPNVPSPMNDIMKRLFSR